MGQTLKPARLSWLQQQWSRLTPWHIALFPISLLFGLVASFRRFFYRVGLLRTIRLPVPVIVVGNISVGGTGKTPLVLWLADYLRQQGYRPGIVSRGYGGGSGSAKSVSVRDDPALVGDEPLLLARKSNCPVWVGHDRVMAGKALLSAHPECDVLVSDDGLQHYRLGRDMEIAVVDGDRKFGNGLLLPAGPLREKVSRLNSVDVVIANGGRLKSTEQLRSVFDMKLEGDVLWNLLQPKLRVRAMILGGKRVHAFAGIGNPQRFFSHLRELGLEFEEHAFPDHYVFQSQDFDFDAADVLLMTEKDAVKCAGFADERFWALAVDAVLPPDFGQIVLKKLRNNDGCQAA